MSKELGPIEVARAQLAKMEPQFKAALPGHMPVERFARVVMTALHNNPDLLMSDRQALWNACTRAAQDGLLPDGREGAIVIYNKNIAKKGEKAKWVKAPQWMPMYQGLLKKVRNSDELKSISAHVVYANDKFFYRLGDDERIEHEPLLDGDRGRPKLVYAVAHTKDGGVYREVMTVADVEKVRSVSRAKDGGPWVDWWEEMAKKTVIRRMSKRLPMSTDLDDLMRRDEEDQYDLNGRNQTIEHQEAPKSLSSALDRLAAPAEAEDGKVIDGASALDNGDGLDVPDYLDRSGKQQQKEAWRSKMEAALNECQDGASLFRIKKEMNAARENVSQEEWEAVEALFNQMFDRLN